jgi:hypothetical protein
MGSTDNGVWIWRLTWRREIFVWEEAVVRELEETINTVVITYEDDRWVWRPNVEEDFSVKSLYMALDSILLPRTMIAPLEAFAFTNI